MVDFHAYVIAGPLPRVAVGTLACVFAESPAYAAAAFGSLGSPASAVDDSRVPAVVDFQTYAAVGPRVHVVAGSLASAAGSQAYEMIGSQTHAAVGYMVVEYPASAAVGSQVYVVVVDSPTYAVFDFPPSVVVGPLTDMDDEPHRACVVPDFPTCAVAGLLACVDAVPPPAHMVVDPPVCAGDVIPPAHVVADSLVCVKVGFLAWMAVYSPA